MKNLFLLLSFWLIGLAQLFAQDISHVIVYYIENGSSKTLTVNAGNTANISRDHSTQIDVRIYKTSSAPNPSLFQATTWNDGGTYQESSSNNSILFTNIGSPITTQIQCLVNTNLGRIVIYVENLSSEFPDLHPRWIFVNDSQFPDGKEFEVGETVDVTATIENLGDADAGSFRVGYYLGNTTNDYSDRFGYRSITSLSAGISTDRTISYTFSEDDVGTQYFNVWADYRNDVDEGLNGADNNKKSWGPFTVISQPPQASVNPSSYDFGEVSVGETKDFEFQITNTGGGTLNGTASVSTPFSIVSGGSYSLTQGQNQNVKVRFSPTEPETYQNVTVTFTAFSGGEGTTAYVSGSGFQNYPNAEIIHLAIDPYNVDPNQNFYIGVSLKNTGNANATVGGISISFPNLTEPKEEGLSFYMSSQANVVFHDNTTIENKSFHDNGSIIWHANNTNVEAEYLLAEAHQHNWEPNEEHTVVLVVTPKLPGEFNIKVRGWLELEEQNLSTDPREPGSGIGTDQQGYYTFEEIVTVNNVLPNLTVSSISAPNEVSIGENYQMSFTIENIGTAGTPMGFSNEVRISQDEEFNNGVHIAFRNSSALEIGDQYHAGEFGINIPESFSGIGYLLVKADAEDIINELDETNNIGVYPIYVNTPPIINVDPFDEYDFGNILIGNHRDFQFTLTNNGDEILNGSASVAPPFSIVSGENYSIESGDNHIVTVRFTPSSPPQTYEEILYFTGGGDATVNLSGTGVDALNLVDFFGEVTAVHDFLGYTMFEEFVMYKFEKDNGYIWLPFEYCSTEIPQTEDFIDDPILAEALYNMMQFMDQTFVNFEVDYLEMYRDFYNITRWWKSESAGEFVTNFFSKNKRKTDRVLIGNMAFWGANEILKMKLTGGKSTFGLISGGLTEFFNHGKLEGINEQDIQHLLLAHSYYGGDLSVFEQMQGSVLTDVSLELIEFAKMGKNIYDNTATAAHLASSAYYTSIGEMGIATEEFNNFAGDIAGLLTGMAYDHVANVISNSSGLSDLKEQVKVYAWLHDAYFETIHNVSKDLIEIRERIDHIVQSEYSTDNIKELNSLTFEFAQKFSTLFRGLNTGLIRMQLNHIQHVRDNNSNSVAYYVGAKESYLDELLLDYESVKHEYDLTLNKFVDFSSKSIGYYAAYSGALQTLENKFANSIRVSYLNDDASIIIANQNNNVTLKISNDYNFPVVLDDIVFKTNPDNILDINNSNSSTSIEQEDYALLDIDIEVPSDWFSNLKKEENNIINLEIQLDWQIGEQQISNTYFLELNVVSNTKIVDVITNKNIYFPGESIGFEFSFEEENAGSVYSIANLLLQPNGQRSSIQFDYEPQNNVFQFNVDVPEGPFGAWGTESFLMSSNFEQITPITFTKGVYYVVPYISTEDLESFDWNNFAIIYREGDEESEGDFDVAEDIMNLTGITEDDIFEIENYSFSFLENIANSKDVILIGGHNANPLVAEITTTSLNQEGDAIVELFTEAFGTKNAIVVAGYTLRDTQIAAMGFIHQYNNTDTSIPEAPYLTSISQINNNIYIEWNPSLEDNIAVYNIYRGETPETTSIYETISIGGPTSFSDEHNLTVGSEYYYRIKAVNINGVESDFSNELSVVYQSYPELTSKDVFDITANTAKSGGRITSDGGSPVSSRGVVWSTSTSPTINNNDGITSNGQSLGEFISNISDLESETTYYIKAYATNSIGTAYGQQEIFTTLTEDTETYSITLNSNPTQGGTVSGGGSYAAGAEVPISAIPNSGFEFINWSGDVDYVANAGLAGTNVTMPAYDISLTANFEEDSNPGTNLLAYWIEETERVWIKIPNIPANDIIKLEIQKTGTESPDGDMTFEFFDDFSGSSLDSEKWKIVSVQGSVSVNDGNLVLVKTGSYGTHTVVQSEYGLMPTDYKNFTIVGRHSINWKGNFESGAGIGMIKDNYDFDDYFAHVMSSYSSGTSHYHNRLRVRSDGGETYQDNKNILENGWWRYEILADDTDNKFKLFALRESTNFETEFYVDNPFDGWQFNETDQRFTIRANMNAHTDYWDYVFLAHYNRNLLPITVTDKTTHYEVLIDNTSGLELADYQIAIDAADIEGVANDESLEIVFEDEDYPQYSLSINANPTQGGTVSGGGSYEAGANVSVIATANSGYTFVNWTGDTNYIANANSASTTVDMPAYDISLTANFEEDGDPGTNMLAYWIEETERVWIKIQNIPANDIIKLEIQKTGTESPDGFNTFSLFNDFSSGNPFDGGSVTSDVLRLTRGTGTIYANADLPDLENGYRIITRSRRDNHSLTRYYIRFYDSVAEGIQYNVYYDACDWTGSSCLGGKFDITKPLASETLLTHTESFSHSTSFETWEMSYDGIDKYTINRDGITIVSDNVTDINTSDYDEIDMFGLNTHSSGPSNWMEFNWFFIAKKVSNEPIITVTNENTHYEIEIDNIAGDELVDYQIVIDAADLEGVANDESLEIVFEDEDSTEYNLSVNGNPADAGNVFGEGSYQEGETIAISANAHEGYNFVNWTGDTDYIENANSASPAVTMPAYNITLTANFDSDVPILIDLPFTENFTVISTDELPDYWNRTHSNWAVVNSSNAGGEASEMRFFWSPSSVDIFRLISPKLDATNESSVNLSFMHSVDDYEGDYTLKVQTSLDGNTWTDRWVLDISKSESSKNMSREAATKNDIPATEISVNLNDLAGEEFYIAFVFDGNSYNINFWYIDDVFVGYIEPSSYLVDLNANPSQGGTVSGGGSYEAGAEVPIAATPNSGYEFVNWTGDTNYIANVNSASTNVTMPSNDISLTANFEPITYTLSLNANPTSGGSVSGDGSYTEGSTVPVSATPSSGYTFVNWRHGNTVVSTSSSFNYTMPANDVTLTAYFEPINYSLTLEINPSGSAYASGGGTYNLGESIYITTTPNDGYEFIKWRNHHGNTVSNSANFYYTMPDENMTLIADFEYNVGMQEDIFSEVEIFPNPFSNNITIVNSTNIRNVVITNLIGQEIIERSNIGDDKMVISTDNLPKGAYIITLTDDLGFKLVRKMIKN